MSPDLRLFALETFTRNVSGRGCCLLLERRPDPGSLISVQPLPRGGQQVSRLLYAPVWTRRREGGWEVGALAMTGVNLLALAFGLNPD